MNDPQTFVVHAGQALTMPDNAPSLPNYDPDALDARDAEITGLIEDACIFVRDGVVDFVGPWQARPKAAKKDTLPLMQTRVATPGWVECHTHSVFEGHRADEFMLRNAGRPYVEILESGGGILNTAARLRKTSQDDLAQELMKRTLDFVRRGVTTLEVKSGYGLTLADELKSLKAVQAVAEDAPCELVGCFLGAHAIPADYRDRREAYVDLVCNEMIPAVAKQKLAVYCDVFCDRGAFTVDEARRVLETGKKHGLIPRIHADELTNAGAAMLAAEVGCSSADHLEFTPDDAIAAMAAAGVVAVLMPAVNLFLGTTDHMARARDILNAGCEVALSTDFNPGSAMTQDIALMTTLACTLYKMTPGEALRAVTIGGAKALRRDDIGRIRVGHRANLALFDVPTYKSIPYHFGTNHVEAVIHDGEFVYWTEEN
ncbi:MAG: imidazolonepropionase [bacterium]